MKNNTEWDQTIFFIPVSVVYNVVTNSELGDFTDK